MSRKLNEIRSSLNSQIQDAITTAKTEKVLPSIQNTLNVQRKCNYTVRGGPKVQWATKETRNRKSPENVGNHPKLSSNRATLRQLSKQSSVDSYSGYQHRNMVTGSNPTPHMVPEFLNGRCMNSREPLQRQDSINNESGYCPSGP